MAKKKLRKKSPQALTKRDFLTIVAKSRGRKRRNALIQVADKSEISALSECVMNFLAGKVKMPKKHLEFLKKYKKAMRLIAEKNKNLKTKKSLLQKKGEFLPEILPFALRTIGKLEKQ